MSAAVHTLAIVDELRLLHFADLHLGVETGGRPNASTGLNQRIHDVCDRLDEVCETVERDGVHAVVFAGDAFKHQHPTPTLQSLFAARMRRLARAGASVFLLVGNHDLPKMAGLAHPFSIYSALEVEGVVVGDRAIVYELPLPDGAPAPVLQVGALPHFSRHQVLARLQDADDPEMLIEQRLSETVRGLGEAVDPTLPAVFAGHCHVGNARVGDAQSLFGVSDVEVSLSTLLGAARFPYYALGHVHGSQILNDEPFVAYSGSLERVDFGEGERFNVAANGSVTRREPEPKGFYRFDLIPDGDAWRLAAAPQFREVAARRFVTVRIGKVSSNDPAADLEARLARARDAGFESADAFVRVIGVVDASERGRITANGARALLHDAYDVRVALEVTEEALVRDPRFAERMSELDALERFLEAREEWAADRDELRRLGRELIAQVLG